VICLEPLREPTTLPCSHSFCRQCIEDLKKKGMHRDPRCPLCRAPLPPGPKKLYELAWRIQMKLHRVHGQYLVELQVTAKNLPYVVGRGCPTPNTQRPTRNTQHPTPKAQRPTPNTQCPTLNTRHPTGFDRWPPLNRSEQKMVDDSILMLQESSDQEDDMAPDVLGECKYIGYGVVPNLTDACEHFRIGAERGNASSENHYGM
jgi:hypothetical protein